MIDFYSSPAIFKSSNRGSIFKKLTGSLLASTALVLTVGCSRTPPDHRPQVVAPVYESGDSQRGEQLYEDQCSQCHTLRPGSNKKGPQLVGVYMAPSALLNDYKYSEVMENADLVWDAETLDTYIADPEAKLPETKMLSDPIPNSQDRQDIIAYLSTLGREAPPEPEEAN